MRGGEGRSGSLFSYVDLEARVPRVHPLRTIRAIVGEALARLRGDLCADRPALIPPEQLLRALKPYVRISRIRLSDWLHLDAHGGGPR
jgi:hypothetical protein